MTRKELEAIVTRFMDSFTTMTLTCTLDDQPWAAAVYYARQGFDLIFFSSSSSRHSTILAQNIRAAATIHGDYKGWKEIKGIQMEGTVEPITGRLAKARAIAAYLKRHPFAKEFLAAPTAISPGLVSKMAKVGLYRFRPANIRYLDNERSFGTRWRLDMEDGKPVGEPVLD